jgi:hypothetical protein
MKSILAVIFILVGFVFSATAQHQAHIPMIYFAPTQTPAPPPTPPGYDWIFVGVAFSFEPPETLVVWGHKPGFCYDVLYKVDGSVIDLWAQKSSDCNPDDWHGEVWPPPEFPVPPSIPPEFDYGEIFKIEIPVRDLDFLRACSKLSGCVWAIQVDPPP